jgi:tetratricopeptide (TPR) repeat protein
MPVTVSAPRIASKELPREILAADFKSIGELPIHGGWGYSREDAVIIDRNDPVVPRGIPFDGVGLEYVFVEKRIYEELIIFRPENDRYSGIRWNLLRQEMKDLGSRQYDILTFEVTALRDEDWEELKAEWEGPNGYGAPGFDEAAHLQKRDARTVRYVTEYWFDITSFFGLQGPSAEQSPARQHEPPTREQYEACAQAAHEFTEISGMGLLDDLLPQEADSAHACQMGIWYWSLGHRRLAVMAYRRSIELGESAAAYFNLAVCQDDLEEPNQALEAMRRFYDLVPNDAERTQAEAMLRQHGKTHLIRRPSGLD